MNNPEFRRNLWREFSTQRLIGMPAILTLLLLAVVLSNQSMAAPALYNSAVTQFLFLVWLWGLSNANNSIMYELRDNTWDQQRMSAIEPWNMTWGKLFGSTAYNWYGGLICLAVAALAGGVYQTPDYLLDLLTLVTTGVFLHAASISLNLYGIRIDGRVIQRGGMGWILLLFIFILCIVILFSRDRWSTSNIIWWDIEVPHSLFLFFSTLLFAACAVFAAWRNMCTVLQVRTRPWAWPLFAILLGGYLTGFANMNANNPAHALFTTTLWVAVAMTYASLITESTGLVAWHRLQLLARAGNWRGWFQTLPLWPTTLVVAFLFALLDAPFLLLTGNGDIARQYHIEMNFIAAPLAIALMLLRDVCIFLFFDFSPKKRTAGIAMLYLVLLDLLVPYLALLVHLDFVAYFFLPVGLDSPWVSVWVMAIHAAIAISLLVWRLRSKAVLAASPA